MVTGRRRYAMQIGACTPSSASTTAWWPLIGPRWAASPPVGAGGAAMRPRIPARATSRRPRRRPIALAITPERASANLAPRPQDWSWRSRHMSYPEPRFHGESGEASASYRKAEHEPELVYPNGTRCHYLATGELTRGLFGLYRWESPPRGGGPGPHFHKTFTESFYLVAGQIQIHDGRSWVDAVPGDFVHIPEGGIH